MKIVNGFLIAALLVVPMVFGVFGRPTEMGLSIVPISLAIFFLNVDKFSEFAAGGVRAKLRKVEAATEKAYAAIEDVRKVAATLAEPMMSSIALSGEMFFSMTIPYKLELTKSIEDNLRKLGVAEDEIANASRNVYHFIAREHKRRILVGVKTANLSAFRAAGLAIKNLKYDDWTKQDLLKFISDHNFAETNDELKALWEDFDHFGTKGELRRPELYKSED